MAAARLDAAAAGQQHFARQLAGRLGQPVTAAGEAACPAASIPHLLIACDVCVACSQGANDRVLLPQSLSLEMNQLNGTLPASWGALQALTSLTLHTNPLRG